MPKVPNDPIARGSFVASHTIAFEVVLRALSRLVTIGAPCRRRRLAGETVRDSWSRERRSLRTMDA